MNERERAKMFSFLPSETVHIVFPASISNLQAPAPLTFKELEGRDVTSSSSATSKERRFASDLNVDTHRLTNKMKRPLIGNDSEF